MNAHFENIDIHIAKLIRNAQNRILIAVAWFTNERIGKELLTKTDLDIEIIVDDNTINREAKIVKEIIKKGIDITFVKDLSKKYYIMHNKFSIVDNMYVITGSYNWTYNANTNDENIIILKDNNTAVYYAHEFRRIKELESLDKKLYLSQDEIKKLVSLIYNGLALLLKANYHNLSEGLIANWSNDTIKNKIRKSNEKISNNALQQLGQIAIYGTLIAKYGIEFKRLASEEEKIIALDNYKKKRLQQFEIYIDKDFQYLKIRAINNLLENYSNMIRVANENDSIKILKMMQFIMMEKRALSKNTNSVV